MAAQTFVQRKWEMPLTSMPNPALISPPATQAYGSCSFPVETTLINLMGILPIYVCPLKMCGLFAYRYIFIYFSYCLIVYHITIPNFIYLVPC